MTSWRGLVEDRARPPPLEVANPLLEPIGVHACRQPDRMQTALRATHDRHVLLVRVHECRFAELAELRELAGVVRTHEQRKSIVRDRMEDAAAVDVERREVSGSIEIRLRAAGGCVVQLNPRTGTL